MSMMAIRAPGIKNLAEPARLRLALVAKPGGRHTGVGRYVHMLQAGLHDAGIDLRRVAPALPPLPSACYRLLQHLGIDLRTFMTNYPVWAMFPPADVYHLASQNLASLLVFRRPRGKIVVTVHDIIPYMLRHDPQLCAYRTAAERLFDRLAMAGLRRADVLIADSHYTKRCVIEQLGIAPEKITVIYPGIDHARFQPQPVPIALRERYGLPQGRRYLIYVGSEDPRKNLAMLVRALAELRATLPDLELIKVGQAHFDTERRKLLVLASELGVLGAIHFLDDVPDEVLPCLYNLADVCVMPSLYEGFGFPVLEAMACGTPVVYANSTSLPELAGDAGRLFEPRAHDEHALAAVLRGFLSDPVQMAAVARAGLTHAAMFQWQQCTQQAIRLYGEAISSKERPYRARTGKGQETI
jgi:glycosyltransferase involved in cell wall biosynthesis